MSCVCMHTIMNYFVCVRGTRHLHACVCIQHVHVQTSSQYRSQYTHACLCVADCCACVCVCLCACVVAAGRLKIVSPLRASLSLQHVGTMARCQDTSPSSVLTRRHEEQRLIIYKQTPVHHVWLGTSPALNVTIYEAIRFIAYSI